MEHKTRVPLTPLDVCTLIACEAVSMLDAAPDTLRSAAELRSALTAFSVIRGLGKEGAPLLAWVDAEIDSAKRFAECGEDSPHLVDPDRLLAVPDAVEQLELVWMLFDTAIMDECTPQERTLLWNAAHTLTEIGGLDDLILTAKPPTASSRANTLREELTEVRAALQVSVEPSAGPVVQREIL